MNGTSTGTLFWVPAPWGIWEGPKGQISLNLNYKVNFIKPNFVYLLTNISDGIFIWPPRSCPGQGWDLGIPWGVGVKKFSSEIQPDLVCELLT